VEDEKELGSEEEVPPEVIQNAKDAFPIVRNRNGDPVFDSRDSRG